MFLRVCYLVLLSAVLSLLALPLRAQQQDRFWILWEKQFYAGENCPGNPRCVVRRNYTSRQFQPPDMTNIYRLFGMLDGNALAQGRLAEHPDAPRICQHNDAEILLGFDPERLPKSEKIEVLRDLAGVHFDLKSLGPPPNHGRNFGRDLHAAFVERFRAAEIPILSKEQVATTPGQPTLSVFFSHSGGDGRCDYVYTVFASLSQTVLLTRDLRIKVSAGTWAFSAASTADGYQGTERDLILMVADRFIQDFQTVNPPEK